MQTLKQAIKKWSFRTKATVTIALSLQARTFNILEVVVIIVHIFFRSTAIAMSAFVDSIQKIADAATNTKGKLLFGCHVPWVPWYLQFDTSKLFWNLWNFLGKKFNDTVLSVVKFCNCGIRQYQYLCICAKKEKKITIHNRTMHAKVTKMMTVASWSFRIL